MNENCAPTRTTATERQYLQIAHQLQRRFLLDRTAASGSQHLVDPTFDPDAPLPDEYTIAAEDAATMHTFTEFAQWFAGACATWRPTTIRLRRAAINYWINHECSNLPADIPSADRANIEQDALTARDLLAAIQMPDKKTLPVRTSARKRKSIPVAILKHLSAFLQDRKGSTWSTRALRFLLAGIVSGLRPIEWNTVHASENADGSLTLTIQNAKATNGRGNGPTRTITIPAGVDRAIVEEHLYELSRYQEEEPEGTYAQYVKSAADALLYANKQVLRGHQAHVTLYSGRHQFAANKKAEGLTKRELAELMGHESEETAGAHYGRRKSGWGRKPGAEQSVALNAARPAR